MKSRFLVVFLIISLIANFYFAFMEPPPQKDMIELKNRINKLEYANAELTQQVYRDNLTKQNYAAQLDLYRQKIANLDSKNNFTPAGLQGWAQLQAPAVMQKIEYIEDYPFVRQRAIEIGSMMNISVEIRPGKGRVLVQTKPLMGVVFQDAANTAVYVAQNKTGKDLSGSDIIFSIEANGEVPQVGEIGGVIEKARAAKDNGKTLILIPAGNGRMLQYSQRTRDFYGITVIEQVPEIIDAKEYIEKNIGISVEYVNNIDEILNYFKPA